MTEARWQSVAAVLALSRREFQIVQRKFDGDTQQEIADELGISRSTVHTHVERLYHKLNIRSHAELLLRVFQAYVSLESTVSRAER